MFIKQIAYCLLDLVCFEMATDATALVTDRYQNGSDNHSIIVGSPKWHSDFRVRFQSYERGAVVWRSISLRRLLAKSIQTPAAVRRHWNVSWSGALYLVGLNDFISEPMYRCAAAESLLAGGEDSPNFYVLERLIMSDTALYQELRRPGIHWIKLIMVPKVCDFNSLPVLLPCDMAILHLPQSTKSNKQLSLPLVVDGKPLRLTLGEVVKQLDPTATCSSAFCVQGRRARSEPLFCFESWTVSLLFMLLLTTRWLADKILAHDECVLQLHMTETLSSMEVWW